MQAGALAPEQQLTHGSVQLTHLAKKLGGGGEPQICLPKHSEQWYVVVYTVKNGAEMWGVGGKESGMGLCG